MGWFVAIVGFVVMTGLGWLLARYLGPAGRDMAWIGLLILAIVAGTWAIETACGGAGAVVLGVVLIAYVGFVVGIGAGQVG